MNSANTFSPVRSAASWARFLVPLVVGLGLDLWIKSATFAALVVGRFPDIDGREQVQSTEHALLGNVLHLHAHVNYGAVFGIGQGNRAMFLVVSVLAIALLVYLFARSGTQRLYQVLLGMLLAGVLGNMYDRITFGHVRDMFYAFPGVKWSDLGSWVPSRIADYEVFPWIFNLADALLCTGVFCMFVYSFWHKDDSRPASETTDPIKSRDSSSPSPARRD